MSRREYSSPFETMKAELAGGNFAAKLARKMGLECNPRERLKKGGEKAAKFLEEEGYFKKGSKKWEALIEALYDAEFIHLMRLMEAAMEHQAD